MVLSPNTYNLIPGAANFVRPHDPGAFVPVNPGGVGTRSGAGAAPPLTAADIATQKLAHDERKRLYNECQAVEALLRTQIVEAIERDYLEPLRNAATDRITDPISDIFTFLQTTYGRLTPAQLKQRETEIDNIIYDPTQNIDQVFNKIQKFQDICTLTSNARTDKQLVTYAYLIFQKSGIFMEALKKWNKKPAADQTYSNMKTFMRKEYNDLDAVGGLTVANSSINMVKELKEHQEFLANNMKESLKQEFAETIQALNLTNEEENMDPNPPPQYNFPFPMQAQPFLAENNYICPQANAMPTPQPSANVLQTLLSQMQQMQNDIAGLTLSNSSYKPRNRNQSNISNSEINPRNGKPWKRYCWSCGCTTHWGRNCPSKKRGHKDEATFRNQMGGSNKGCL